MEEPLLRASSITKRFPGVLALDHVDFELRRGEVHVLLGENGAGKSTLIKILSGALPPDSGAIYLEGRPVQLRSPRQAQELGIRVVHQEFNLVPSLTVAENIHLGNLPRHSRYLPVVSYRRMARESERLLALLGAPVDPSTPVERLTVAEQQMVEIVRALAGQARILILDEPTAALTTHESERLFQMLARLKAQGVSIIYISHRMEEIRRVGDRVTVLRDGRRVATKNAADAGVDELVQLMVGRRVQEHYPRQPTAPGEPVLVLRDLSVGNRYAGVSLTLRSGEIVGLTGPVGCGALDVARTLFGVYQPDAGEIVLRGRSVRFRNPREAIGAGVAFLPEDRKQLGLVLKSGVLVNMTLASLGRFSKRGWLQSHRERQAVRALVDRLGIITPDLYRPVRLLSGGNQQKVVLGKWLLHKPSLYVFAEPTRGLDVGAKEEVYRLMNELTADGAAILLISSDLPEVLGMSDRVVVMSRGRVVGELAGEERTRDRVLALAFGSSAAAARVKGP